MKITQLEIEQVDGSIVEHIMIDRGDGAFMTMTKEAYDLSQVEHLTSLPTDATA